MFSCVDYDYDTRFQCSWYCCSVSIVRCRVSNKREVPPGRGGGSQPTYGLGERRAGYVNMNSLAKGRMRMMRKDAEKKQNVQREKVCQRATSKRAQRRKKKREVPVVQNPAHVTRSSQKSTSLINFAETCKARNQAPALLCTALQPQCFVKLFSKT